MIEVDTGVMQIGLLASRTIRELVSLVLSHVVCDNMLRWSWEIIQYLSGFIVRIK